MADARTSTAPADVSADLSADLSADVFEDGAATRRLGPSDSAAVTRAKLSASHLDAAETSGGSGTLFDAGDSATPRWLGKSVGRFRLLSLLGEGSWGRVFEAEDGDLHRRVALKVLRARDPRTGQTNKIAGGVIREARAAARITHPHVVQVYEVGEDKGLLYIAMELVDGGTLRDLVKSGGPMDAARACLMAADAADALAKAHHLGVIHRDVKPGNLMLSRGGRCMLADFGLATIDDPEDAHRYSRTAGTPHFVAPEIVRGNPADARSDLYALGATLYYLLAGRPPFAEAGGDGSRGDRNGVLRAHLDQTPPPLTSFRHDLEPGLLSVIDKAMAKDPSQRFNKAAELAAALRRYTIAVPAAPAAAAAVPVIQGTRWLALGISSASALLAGLALWFAMDRGDGTNIYQPPAPAELLRQPARQEEAVAADDVEAIRLAAESGGELTLTGRVAGVRLSETSRAAVLTFERGGVPVLWFPGQFEAFEAAYGIGSGNDLVGRDVRVAGKLGLHDGEPEMILTDPAQIEVITSSP